MVSTCADISHINQDQEEQMKKSFLAIATVLFLLFAFGCAMSDNPVPNRTTLTPAEMQEDFNNLALQVALTLDDSGVTSSFRSLLQGEVAGRGATVKSAALIDTRLIESNSLLRAKDDIALFCYNPETASGREKEIVICAADYVKEENDDYSVVGYDKDGCRYQVFGLSDISHVVKDGNVISASDFLTEYAVIGLVIDENAAPAGAEPDTASAVRGLGGRDIYIQNAYFYDVLEPWIKGNAEIFLLVFGKDNTQQTIKNYKGVFTKSGVTYPGPYHIFRWDTSVMGNTLLFYWIEDDVDWTVYLQKINIEVPNYFKLNIELTQGLTTHPGGFTLDDDRMGDALVYADDLSGGITYSTGTVRFNVINQ